MSTTSMDFDVASVEEEAQLQAYMQVQQVPNDTDPLMWWKQLYTKMRDGGVFRTPCADFSRPVEELEYSWLLKNTFTQASHDRGFKT